MRSDVETFHGITGSAAAEGDVSMAHEPGISATSDRTGYVAQNHVAQSVAQNYVAQHRGSVEGNVT
jgi:hypothetical protein